MPDVRCSGDNCRGWCTVEEGKEKDPPPLCPKHLKEKAEKDKVGKTDEPPAAKCSIAGCKKWVFAKGMCRPHAEEVESSSASARMSKFRDAPPLSLKKAYSEDIRLLDMQHLAGGLGSQGAYMCLTTDGVVIAKVAAAPGAAKELLAHVLVATMGPILPTPVRAPHALLVRKTDERAKFLAEAKLETEQQKQHLARLMEQTSPWILLVEFLPGVQLDKLAGKPQHATKEWRQQCLYALGTTLAVDMLLNNWDRFKLPGVWTGQGNSGNLLLLPPDASPVASSATATTKTPVVGLIDHTITVITDPAGLAKYRAAIKRLAAQAKEPVSSEVKAKSAMNRRWSVDLEKSMAMFSPDTEQEMVEAAFRSMQRWIDNEAVGSDVFALQEEDSYLRQGFTAALSTLASPLAHSLSTSATKKDSSPSSAAFHQLLREAEHQARLQIKLLVARPPKQPQAPNKAQIIKVKEDTPEEDEAKRHLELKQEKALFDAEIHDASEFLKLTFSDLTG
eukprot:gb/GEZN01006037.1/.p1 GENE.gb/GEZN01006037.1/~~gb/GEZN01006037.1/.p1  ORF type:complete len:505 (-),score=107.77 gb/GEZN01006037.1/:156-1670(-)